jgi:hypothetical protein
MLIETVKAERNKRKIIEIKSTGPSAEEIASKEEAARAAAAQKGGKKGVVAVEPVEEKKKEEEAVFREEDPNYLDTLFSPEDVGESTIGACVNVTMKNGLIVRHMPNGDIIQIQDSSLSDRTDHTEIDRVYLNGGTVVRHFAN